MHWRKLCLVPWGVYGHRALCEDSGRGSVWLGPNAELRLGVDEVEKSGLDRRLGQVCGPH